MRFGPGDNQCAMDSIKGRLIVAVYTDLGEYGETWAVVFMLSDGGGCCFAHSQDCCEHVRLEDGADELGSLIGGVVVRSEEATTGAVGDDDILEWTFYRIDTDNGGSVCMRWLGESNGYYGVSVEVTVLPDAIACKDSRGYICYEAREATRPVDP